MAIELICNECGETYKVKPYRANKSRFCSFQCNGKRQARDALNSGPKTHLLGNKFRAGKRPANAFKPGITGANHPSWKPGVDRTCEQCGKTFFQKDWLARQNGLARFCGRNCFEASGVFNGELSSCYVGGITTYRGRGWLKARASVIADQCGCCAHCGNHVGKSLPVHHKTPFRDFQTAAEANVRSNLIGLCQSCHMKEEHQNKTS